MITQVMRAFERAVTNPANYNSDGEIIWNFVDADCYMEVRPEDTDHFYDCFNQLAELWEGLQKEVDTVAA